MQRIEAVHPEVARALRAISGMDPKEPER